MPANTSLNPNDLRNMYDEHVPHHIQMALVRGILDGYQTTWADCQESCEPEVALQAWQSSRWNALDSAILSVGKRFKNEGVLATYAPNTDGTHVKHTELRIGRVLITVACVQDRKEHPRSAKYRENLAQSNGGLFETDEPDPEYFWVPLLHIPNIASKQPLNIFAAFPNGDGAFATGHIDLLARYRTYTAAKPEVEVAPTIRILSKQG